MRGTDIPAEAMSLPFEDSAFDIVHRSDTLDFLTEALCGDAAGAETLSFRP